MRVGLAAGLTWAGLAGCQSTAFERQRLNSVNPMERVQATVRLAEAGDAAAVHKLVDLLDDKDPVVRMYAIMALTRLCGQDYGYKYYQADIQRAAAVERWREALRKGEVTVRAPARPHRPATNELPAGLSPAAAAGPLPGEGTSAP